LGDGFKKNTILLFTKADTFQLDSLQGKVAEFLESGNAVPYVNFCQGGIYFTGAVAGELASEYGEMYETKTKHKVSCLRQHIIDAIVGCPDVPLPAAFWTKPEPTPAAPEKAAKPEPAAKPERPEPGSLNSTPSRNSLTPNKKEPTKREKNTDKATDKK